jgi:hypothetical protein
MKNFFIKIYTLILFSLGITNLSAATTEPIELNIVGDILDATRTPAKMSMQKCVLDFSKDGAQSSVFKITGYLLSSGGIIGGDSHKKLYWPDFSYLMCESLAAWVRQSPGDFPKLANFFNNKDAVYTAFGKIVNTVDTTERELSALADLKNCEAFVKETIDKDLPLLLGELIKALPSSLSSVGDLAKDHQSEILSVAKKFAPQIAQLVNVSYIGLSKASDAASAAVSNFVQAIEDGGCCGCFPSFRKSKKK